MTRYTPFMFTVQDFHHSRGSDSASRAGFSRYPALLIRISNRPNSDSIPLAAASTLFWSVTSRLRASTLGSERFADFAAALISPIKESRLDRAPIAMYDAPDAAKESAVARPIPFEAPVMKTARPVRFCLVGSMNGYDFP